VNVKIKMENPSRGENEKELEEMEGNEAEQEHSVQKEKASSALLPPKRGKLKRKVKVKEENLGIPESPNSEVSKPSRGTWCQQLNTEAYTHFKGYCSTKNENSVINYSPSCRSKLDKGISFTLEHR